MKDRELIITRVFGLAAPGARACEAAMARTTGNTASAARSSRPPERLEYTLIWDNDPAHETLVTVVFVERGAKTEMTFRQRPFKSVEERDAHQGGWSSAFHRLETYLVS